MSKSAEMRTGTGYTMTVALLVMAFFFCPAIWMASRPVSGIFLSVTIVCGVLFATLAWITWKKSSRLTVPSITTHEKIAK